MASAKKKDGKKQPLSAAKHGRHKKVAIEDEATRNDDLINKVLPENFVKELMELTDVKEIESKLGQHFNLNDIDLDLKQEAILDVYTGAVWWGQQQKFTADQVSGFFTMVHTLLENVKERGVSLAENMLESKKMIVSSQGKPEVFSVTECKAVSDYINVSFQRHYKLLKFMFGVCQAEEIIGADLSIEVVPPIDLPYPPPLCEAVTLEMYQDYIATPPPSPQLEEQVEEEEKEEEVILKSNALNELTIDDIREVFCDVSTALLSNVQSNIKELIQSKENDYIARINKIHRVLP